MSLAERLERLTANVKVTIVLDLIPASSDTVKSEAADEIVLNKVKNKLIKNPKIPMFNFAKIRP